MCCVTVMMVVLLRRGVMYDRIDDPEPDLVALRKEYYEERDRVKAESIYKFDWK